MNWKLIIVIGALVLSGSFLLYILHSYIKLNATLQPSSINTASSIPVPLEDLVGQRFIWGITGSPLSSESAALIMNTRAGGVVLMGELTSIDIATITSQIQSLPHVQPFIIAIDQEGGSVKRMIDDENPGGYQLGQMDDKTFCVTLSQTSDKLERAGVNTNFGIIGDIGWSANAYITNRTYGNTLESILLKTALALQCSQPMLTTIKHFPGHGRTVLNSHFTVPIIQTPFDEWVVTDARPFLESIKQGVDIVMFGHLRYASIASEPASLSPYFHTFLRGHGFTGLTITDDLGMLENSNMDPMQTMKKAFEADNDMLLYVTSNEDPYRLFQEALLYATSSTEIYNSFQQHYTHIQSFKQQRLAR